MGLRIDRSVSEVPGTAPEWHDLLYWGLGVLILCHWGGLPITQLGPRSGFGFPMRLQVGMATQFYKAVEAIF